MRLAFGVYPDIVFLRLDPADIFDREKQDASARFEDHSGCVVLLSRILQILKADSIIQCQSLPGALNSRSQSLGRERLEQVIDRAEFERLQRVLLERSGEHE